MHPADFRDGKISVEFRESGLHCDALVRFPEFAVSR
jgi:hypothetical protein